MVGICRRVVGPMAVLAVLAFAAPAMAQTGGVRGKVTDASGNPVDGAVIRIEAKSVTRKLQVKTNKKGEYIQIGLYPGEYVITAEKDKLTASNDVRVGLGDPTVVDLQLRQAAPTKEEQDKKLAELQAVFDAGVAASRAQKYDESIANFQKAIEMAPNCQDCYYNIGHAYVQKKDYPQAEAAFKKATEIKPDYAEAWSALANVYNQQKKLDEALAASQKAAQLSGGAAGAGAAAGGGGASALYNQGVILWNQGKYSEARDQFEAATKADPKYAEAQYRLGMANVNLGDMPKAVSAFEAYLQADPNGQHAAEVKQFLAAMKK